MQAISQKKFKRTNLFVSLSLIVFFIQDVVYDILYEQQKSFHFYLEFAFVIVLITLFYFQFREFKGLYNRVYKAEEKLNNLREGLQATIEGQLNAWQLTKAEKEVAWLTIKGVSYSKIAELRGVSERTVSQQISNIFKKSNVNNRHEFISSFVEDLIAPDNLDNN